MKAWRTASDETGWRSLILITHWEAEAYLQQKKKEKILVKREFYTEFLKCLAKNYQKLF